MDKTDRLIINSIQSDFPVSKRPYMEIAQSLGLDEDEVIERIRKLRQNDVIRRIGGNFFPDKLGFLSTLCAAEVPEEKIDFFSETVNSYDGVTHNYIRKNRFNVWFTFIAQSMEDIEKSLEEIKTKTGVENILNLPATDVFKIRAKFKV
ncbi:MAG: AsnC family transcriptional regulator [Desulfobacteraceae bacterium]|nr:AsnC family transcriptional regulator [Desulfobacteraceae bacterium]MCB9494826.1 AsnC family transcriptional regulator [Desulfobacteraceae bacterium]